MKIKEVQISNFRAFNDVKNSTFNFINEKNEISDLISIYAPNGYGKTSFYDAVEWGMTGKIERFDLVGDFEKTRKENKKGGNKNILQHIGASENGFVNIVTQNETIGDKISGSEYNHKKIPKNKFFRDVILSQEMIDNFLKEQTAEERYNKFVDSYPDVSKFNESYKNIITLLSFISQETKRLESEKKENEDKQLVIDFDLEFKKFDQINEAIQFLRSNQESLEIIEKETFNETTYDILNSQIKSRLVSLAEIIIKSKFKIEKIRIALDGDKTNNSGGLIHFIENKKKLDNFEVNINELKKIITLIENKDTTQNEVNNINEKLITENNLQKRSLEIENKIDTFLKLNNEVIDQEKRIDDLIKSNIEIETGNSTLNENNLKFNNDIKKLQNELQQIQSKSNELPSQKSKIELVRNKLEPIKKELSAIIDTKSKKERLIEAVRLKLNQLSHFENKIIDDLEILLEINEFQNEKNLIVKLLLIKDQLVSEQNELLQVQIQINSQNELNNELKDYITHGLEIINKNNSKDCPLCSQKYKSFEELSNRIIDNKSLNGFLKQNLEFKRKIENTIKDLNDQLNLGLEKLKSHLSDIIKPFKTDYLKLEKEIQRLLIQQEEKNIELNIIQITQNEANLFFGNESDLQLFEDNLNKTIEQIMIQISELNSTINSQSSKIIENQNNLKSNNENIKILKNAISKIKRLEIYYTVVSFFSEELKTNEISKIYFAEEKEKLEISLLNLNKKLKEKQNVLEELKLQLLNNNLPKGDYIRKIQEIQDSKILILKVYEFYESYIRTEFGVDLKNKEKKQIESEFDKLIENEKNTQKTIDNKIERFKIIDVLKEDCLSTSVFKRIQNDIDKIKDRIKNLKKAAKILNLEKNSLEIYLKKTIDGFFYANLINAIYKKIDPHPDYNSIEFKCEFGESKPRLQIFTLKKDEMGNEIKSVPALYFSTAQINILSLSIFLARALKAKNPDTNEPIDCIFIDDPIQSMDSINILSFIDLFRGIILFLGKQLIVSTHEENFHLLLQKKIPAELFDSKYIEFATFGKLKKTS